MAHIATNGDQNLVDLGKQDVTISIVSPYSARDQNNLSNSEIIWCKDRPVLERNNGRILSTQQIVRKKKINQSRPHFPSTIIKYDIVSIMVNKLVRLHAILSKARRNQ